MSRDQTVIERPTQVALAAYQTDRVVALQQTAQRIVAAQVANPAKRDAIAQKSGTILLQSPTGSGKTLMLARAVEGLVGKLARKCVWLWFAPYTGIVEQTKAAISEQCPGLRLRDATRDREPGLSRDGDVYVQTWASVAANRKDARVMRRTREDAFGLDAMLDMLRLDGFAIGVVIDEAHTNFGTGAAATSDFFLNVLKPDITILASATPNDDKLAAFTRRTGIEIENRLTVAREDVVAAGLNKTGLMLGYLSIKDEDRALIDQETAILTAAWHQHQRVRTRLSEKGIDLTPLMLVQVENDGDDPDPVARVRGKLEAIGIDPAAIASHTAREPDADFHTIAFDPSREVLIFKMAAATGFDAPRAWTLVSVRPNQDANFGLQIVGRIMRVHPLVRPYHQTDPLLDRGYVFLGDLGAQAGLQAAADTLQAVQSSIETVCDRLDLVDLGGGAKPLRVSDINTPYMARPIVSEPPKSADERQRRLDVLIAEKRVPETVRDHASELQDRAIVQAEAQKSWEKTDLFGGDLPEQRDPNAPEAPGAPQRSHPLKTARYDRRRDVQVPLTFKTELPPHLDTLNSEAFNRDMALIFVQKSQILNRLFQREARADLTFEDMFSEALENMEDGVSIRLDDSLIMKQGQLAFRFNDDLDDRQLKRAIEDIVQEQALDKGFGRQDRATILRAIYLAAMREPDALKAAQAEAYGRYVHIGDAEPMPDFVMDYDKRPAARLNLYGMMPSDLNGPESRFAEMLDRDTSGVIRWWTRLPHRAGGTRGWNPGLILPNGRYFFPDFAICVAGRSTEDGIALAEVKGDQFLGDTLTIAKIRNQHRAYGKVKWVDEGDELFMRLTYNETYKRIVPSGVFEIADFQHL